jgi:tetratricopeptide (TPR) repeat protein
LIEWGLLTPVYESDELSRMDVHSLVRDFCREKQAGTWRDRLREAASFYTNLTRLIIKEHKTPAIVWNEMEAFELLIEAEDYRDASVLLNNVFELLNRWGFGRYLESQYVRVLDRVERADAARLLYDFGVLQQSRGNYDSALDYYQRALKTFEELGDLVGVADSLHNIGIVQQERGNYDSALDYYQRSLKIEEELDNVAGIATSLHTIGSVQQDRGNYDSALDYYQRSLKIREELGNVAGMATSLHAIGSVQQDRGNYDVALDYYQRSLKIREELGDMAGIADSLHNIGMVQQTTRMYDTALDYYQRSLKIEEELGNASGIADSQDNIGQLLTETGHYAEAFEWLLKAHGIYIQLQSPNQRLAMDDLKTLRGKWDGFDAAWREATGEDAPEGL